uniref:hypothetical protein n=1 Tax=Hafnia alvei TaxID=569 RepID=UPI00248D448B
GVREEVASAQPLDSRDFYRVAWPTGLGAHIPVRPQPATSTPAGGSKMHSLNIKNKRHFCLLIFLFYFSIFFLLFKPW